MKLQCQENKEKLVKFKVEEVTKMVISSLWKK